MEVSIDELRIWLRIWTWGLRRQRDDLLMKAAMVPLSALLEAMIEEQIPLDTATEMVGAMELVASELDRLADVLEDASRIDDEALRRRFAEQRAKEERFAEELRTAALRASPPT